MTAIQTHDATSSHHHEAAQRGRWLSSSMGHFIRHYIEMVVAMFLGMAVLGVPAGWALGAVGSSWSELNTDAPALMLLGMAVTMTVPMVAWMRYGGQPHPHAGPVGAVRRASTMTAAAAESAWAAVEFALVQVIPEGGFEGDVAIGDAGGRDGRQGSEGAGLELRADCPALAR